MSEILAGGLGKVASQKRAALAPALLRTARPRQWLKNGLVLTAPAGAGALGSWETLRPLSLTFLAFCLVASGVYFLNDVRDVEQDRRHPRKCARPIAAGVVPIPVAIFLGIVLMLFGFATASAVGWPVAAVVAGYVALTSAYTVWLKNLPVIELAAVAGCFVARALAGGAATDVPLSRWYLIVVSFTALFVVAAKRHSEQLENGTSGSTRAALAAYPLSFLRYVWMLASGVGVVAYCLWAFAQDAGATVPMHTLTIIPFVLFLLHYALLVERGEGGAPEELIVRDRTLLVLGSGWVALYAAAVAL
jgi:decaprenyl-phosphate phosphoribosyltransferase